MILSLKRGVRTLKTVFTLFKRKRLSLSEDGNFAIPSIMKTLWYRDTLLSLMAKKDFQVLPEEFTKKVAYLCVLYALCCKSSVAIFESFLRFYLLYKIEKGRPITPEEVFKNFIEFEVKVQENMLSN